MFPDLYTMSRSKFGLVKDFMIGEGNMTSRNLHTQAVNNDWEVDNVIQMFVVLQIYQRGDGDDQWSWAREKNNAFTVSSLYAKIGEENNLEAGEIAPQHFPYKLVWKKVVPSKNRFFIWCAILNQILTIDNIERRGMSIPNSCVMCGTEEETIMHLFMHCNMTKQVWNALTAGIFTFNSSPTFLELKDVLLLWATVTNFGRRVWEVMSYATLCCLWRARNDLIFHNKSTTVGKIIIALKACIWFWVSNTLERSSRRFEELITN
ncbi:hypothetical protein IFM89_030067 [Coptis chinensis]|uniref:Reverse transcriptase zinc-binding domain-containing protein n=1 Tax=Coptis chinensis TaxID=261450 RepID=A0A835MCN3_9MAGN|nr:hypothetical protein IFM89_030067 [Coptis chinensis]